MVILIELPLCDGNDRIVMRRNPANHKDGAFSFLGKAF